MDILEQDPNESDDSFDSSVDEVSPCGRYLRFKEKLSKFEHSEIHRGMDTEYGCEVSWCLFPLVNLSIGQLLDLKDRLSALTHLCHRNIILLFDSWVIPESKTLVLISELLSGGNIREYLKKTGRPRLKVLKTWGREILAGLSFLHSQSPPIILKDLKLECLFVNSNDASIKIGNYAISKIVQDLSLEVMGSPEYMAPEAFGSSYTQKADIYSFGICMLEIASAQHPYKECTNKINIYNKIYSGAPPHCFYSVMDEEFKSLVKLCWKKAPLRPEASTLIRHRFFEINEADTRLNSPLQLQALDIIEEVDEALTNVDYLDDETIEISIIIKFNKDQLRQVTFPFSLRSDEPMNVAEEMVKELNLDSIFVISFANIIQQKMDDANTVEDPTHFLKLARRYSDNITRPINVTDGFSIRSRWSLGDLSLITGNEDKSTRNKPDISIDASPVFK